MQTHFCYPRTRSRTTHLLAPELTILGRASALTRWQASMPANLVVPFLSLWIHTRFFELISGSLLAPLAKKASPTQASGTFAQTHLSRSLLALILLCEL